MGGGGAFWSEIPERGFLENLLFSQKPACASQIVSHILRMWRLMKTRSIAESRPGLNYEILGMSCVHLKGKTPKNNTCELDIVTSHFELDYSFQ